MKSEINGKLISFTVAGAAADLKDFPTRKKLLNWGRNETVKGPVIVGPATLKHLAANQRAVGFSEIALDYNHQTVPESPEYERIVAKFGSIDPIEVAAYMAPEVVENDGLYVNFTRWTPSGQANTPNYQDLSPTPGLDENGEVIFLHSVALVRQGAVDGLSLYSADFRNAASLKPSMKKPITLTVDFRASLIKLLKLCGATLPDNPTDAELAELADKYQPDTENPTLVTMSAQIEAAVDKRLKPLAERQEKAERQSLIDKATAAGKVVPLSAELVDTIPLTTLSAMIEKLPVTVPLAARGKSKEAEQPKVTTLSANQKAICQNLGISEETYLKTLKAEQPAELVMV